MNDSLPDVWTSTVTMLMELDTDCEDPQDSMILFVADDYHGHAVEDPEDVLFLLDDEEDDDDMMMGLSSSPSFDATATPYSPLQRQSLHASACISPDSILTDDTDERLLLSSLPPVMPPPPLFVSSLAVEDDSLTTRTASPAQSTSPSSSSDAPNYQVAAQKLMERMQQTDETRKQIGEQVFLNIQLTARQELYLQLTAAAKMA